jgi:GTP pyrophosphokinase
MGYISRGRGVIVHTHDCPNLKRLEPERLIPVSWEGQEDKPYPAKIAILAHNKKGVLAKISNILSDDGVNIDAGTFNSNVDGRTEIVLTVEVKDSDHLYRSIVHIQKLPEVIEVKRMVEEAAQ